VTRREFRDSAAIVGVGRTAFSRASGRTTTGLAVEAILAALADAGLTPSDVDGIATHALGDSCAPQTVARALGIGSVQWSLEEYGGGSKSHIAVGAAAAAVHIGLADCIVVFRALNGRSGLRMGGSTGAPMPTPETSYERPYGLVAPVQHYALMARAHMSAYGTTQKQLGAVAVNQRENAVLNERAVMRTPISIEDYLASPWISEPFKLLDCCLETDAACAVVVVNAARAKDLRRPPVYISAARSGLGWNMVSGRPVELGTTPAAQIAPLLFADADMAPTDVDVAELYDCFSYTVIAQLEDYGFCEKGEGGPFVEAGEIALHGRIPVNTHGGFLSEGYVHGMNHVCEAVDQLRGDAGNRQVENCRVALSTGQPGYVTGVASALLMRS
jgi:acetyl-CoA acetyltransferase